MGTPICPYCDEAALLVDRGMVDSRHPIGFAWACLPCEAWVPCHHKSQKPMGRLANAALHDARREAMKSFSQLWKVWGAKRKDAYLWLAEHMGIEPKECDFYKFDMNQCAEAQDISDSFTPQFTGEL